MLLIMRVAEDLMALQGFGGCPMAKDDLTYANRKVISYFTANKENTNLNPLSFESAYRGF
jgi:hydroxymethylglutaryl-CoA lyase